MSAQRCRWCGSHNVGRIPAQFDCCRARLENGPCVEWEPGMPHWPPIIALDEYVDEETFEIKRRATP